MSMIDSKMGGAIWALFFRDKRSGLAKSHSASSATLPLLKIMIVTNGCFLSLALYTIGALHFVAPMIGEEKGVIRGTGEVITSKRKFCPEPESSEVVVISQPETIDRVESLRFSKNDKEVGHPESTKESCQRALEDFKQRKDEVFKAIGLLKGEINEAGNTKDAKAELTEFSNKLDVIRDLLQPSIQRKFFELRGKGSQLTSLFPSNNNHEEVVENELHGHLLEHVNHIAEDLTTKQIVLKWNSLLEYFETWKYDYYRPFSNPTKYTFTANLKAYRAVFLLGDFSLVIIGMISEHVWLILRLASPRVPNDRKNLPKEKFMKSPEEWIAITPKQIMRSMETLSNPHKIRLAHEVLEEYGIHANGGWFSWGRHSENSRCFNKVNFFKHTPQGSTSNGKNILKPHVKESQILDHLQSVLVLGVPFNCPSDDAECNLRALQYKFTHEMVLMITNQCQKN
ncbi:hypothetical protein PSTT_15688 [Puccinia striiformis]|uniref:Uncharacterized protein n=1 Tax=Puccinia striiformis TaxID=27350 RepID=A0A2S4UGF0_9BASI|nr:hypothetical protein PSTT_15688 [Puccinia striiformis]